MCPFGTHHFQQNDLFGIWALQCFRTQIVKKTPANLPEGHQLCLCPGRAYLGSSAEEVRGEKPVFFYTQNLCREKCKPKKTQGIYLFFFGYAAYVPSPLMYCHMYTYVLFHHLFPLCTVTLGMFPMFFSSNFMQRFGLWWCWCFLKSKLQLGTPSTIPSQISQAPTLVPPVYLCQVIFFYPKTRYGIVGMYPKAGSHGLNYQR